MRTVSAAISALVLAGALSLASAAHAATKPFTPNLKVTSSSSVAGQPTDLSITFEKRQDYFKGPNNKYLEQRFQGVELKLPIGLFPKLGSANYCVISQDSSNHFCQNSVAPVGAATVDLNVDVGEPPGHWFIHVQVTANAYLVQPNPGEVARIALLSPELPSFMLESAAYLNPDSKRVVIKMSDLPLTANFFGEDFTIYLFKIQLKLAGSASQPFFKNPTYCDQYNDTEATFTSYGSDAKPGPPGDDVVVQDLVLFPITGCDAIPYSPSPTLSLTSKEAGAASTLSSSVSMPSGNASTRSISMTMPHEFNLNPAANIKSCPVEQFDQHSCDDSTRLGALAVSSPLLDQDLQGNIFLGPADGERLRVAISFASPFAFWLEGYMEQRPGEGVRLVVPDFPPLLTNSIQLSLASASQGLLRNPVECGDYNVVSTFTSHTGKSTTHNSPLSIECRRKVSSNATLQLNATLSSKRIKSLFDLTLQAVRLPASPITSMRFELPKGLAVHISKKIRRYGSPAYIEFWDDQQQVRRGRLGLDRSSRNSLTLSASQKQLKGLRLKLVREHKGGAVVKLSGIPKSNITDFTLRLWGKRTRMLRLSKSCKRPLVFTVRLDHATARQLSAADSVKPSCGTDHKRVHRRSKRSQRR